MNPYEAPKVPIANDSLTTNVAMTMSYRVSLLQLIVGIIEIPFFSAATMFTFIAAWWNIDGSFQHPMLFAVSGGSIWAALMMMSVWTVVAYYRTELLIGPDEIIYHGVLWEKKLAINDVTHLKWSTLPNAGNVVLYTDSTKLKVAFSIYRTAERKALISSIRANIREDVQEGWTRFESKFVNYLSRCSSDTEARAWVRSVANSRGKAERRD